MTNKPKVAGSRFARDVAAYLAEVLPGVERRVDGGRRDRGDIAGLAEWAVECKAERDLGLAGALNEAKVEAAHAEARWHVAILKRRNHRIRDAYAVVPLWIFRDLVVELHRLRAELERRAA